MGEGVDGEPSGKPGRPVAEPLCGPAVGKLVEGNAGKQHNGQRQKGV